jgi:formamidopyrimidine-DNA glycosylase
METNQTKPKHCPQCGGELVDITDLEALDWYYCPTCQNKMPKPFIIINQ